MEMKSRDSTTKTRTRARVRTEDEDGEFNCVITCALAYAIGSSRASDVLTSVAMLDAIKRSDERSFAAVRGKLRESIRYSHVARYAILERLLIKKSRTKNKPPDKSESLTYIL